MTDNLASTAAKVGLRISTEKTKVMSMKELQQLVLKVNQQEAEEVENITYLGSSISNKGATERDISCRLGKAAYAFQRLSSIWISNHISMKSKRSLYNSLVIPVAIYASKTWKSNNNLAHKLDVFHHGCLRKLLKISWRDHVTNDDVRQRSGQRKLSEIVKEGCLKMLGHILRMPEERLPKTSLEWTPTGGKRERGRPVTTWRRTIQQDLRDMGISWEESKSTAADNIKWRAVVPSVPTGTGGIKLN